MSQTKEILETNLAAIQTQQVILLVDDDEDEHVIFHSALKNITEDFTFISAVSCEHALKILGSVVPDIIFLDVNMPRMNGIKCLEEIRKIKKLTEVPVYIYSTGINAKDGQKAILLGAEDYIIKPNSINALSALLKEILS
jgi:CheY-like chemotaxis protein